MVRSIYFTTPIYYVNAEPHIGHLYTTVVVDTLKRFHRLMGDDVYFLTGTDEHGEKIAQVAEKEGLTPQALTDRVSNLFSSTWKTIGIDNDDFIRTTEPRHKAFVQQVLKQVHDAGDIYFDEYSGLYCVGCERYLTQTELVEGKCPDHQTAPKVVKEANYFFRMGKYQQALLDHINQHPDWIRPERFRNEVLAFLRAPLEDLCISRPKTRLTWGIDIPFDDRFVTYVWFDALLNYVSALSAPTGRNEDLRPRYWPACHHVIAKDILKTHAVYWSTMLMSASLPLPQHLDVHGYLLSGDSKMSKSLGNVVRPLEFHERFGIENLRYFFFREMKFGHDASFTYELFIERYNADLANGLGNLLSRVAAILQKSRGGVLPVPPGEGAVEGKVLALAEEARRDFAGCFEERRFHQAVENVRRLLSATDLFINELQPWRLAKDPVATTELDRVLYVSLEVVRLAAILLSPMMPIKCREILDYLGDTRPLDGSVPFATLAAWGGLTPGYRLGEVPRLFPRIDEARCQEMSAGEGAPGAKANSAKSESAAAAASGAKSAAGSTSGARSAARSTSGGKSTPAPEVSTPLPTITIDDFGRIDLRVGVIREANIIEGAKKLLKLAVDIGEERPRQVFAGIRLTYTDPAVLIGRRVILVANLKPREMKWGISEGMVLAGSGPDRLCVATFGGELQPGDKVS
jgi:methionyl-tRNA synthetase